MRRPVQRFLRLFFRARDGIRDLVRSRGLGDVYRRRGQDVPRDRIGRAGSAAMLDNHSGGVAGVVIGGKADEQTVVAIFPGDVLTTPTKIQIDHLCRSGLAREFYIFYR